MKASQAASRPKTTPYKHIFIPVRPKMVLYRPGCGGRGGRGRRAVAAAAAATAVAVARQQCLTPGNTIMSVCTFVRKFVCPLRLEGGFAPPDSLS